MMRVPSKVVLPWFGGRFKIHHASTSIGPIEKRGGGQVRFFARPWTTWKKIKFSEQAVWPMLA